MSNDLAMMRKNYTRDSLDERDVAANPFMQFATWLAQTEDTMSALEANAMALATVDSHGMPSAGWSC